MRSGSTSEHGTVAAALAEWRRGVAKVLMLASVFAYLPVLALLLAGEGPPLGRPLIVSAAAGYLAVVVLALLRWTDHRPAVWTVLVAGYAVAIVGAIAIPQGPIVRTMPVVLPLLAMVLLGSRAAWGAAAFSAAVVLFAPFLHNALGAAAASAGPAAPMGFILAQSAGLTALLIIPMILLDRFHRLLTQSLGSLEREAAQRSAAHRRLEHEVLERQQLEREVARVGDEERRRLGHDVHDGVCQQITGALLRCEALTQRLERGGRLAVADLGEVSSLLETAIDEAHAVAEGLCPLGPEPRALAGALQTLTRRTEDATGVPCTFSAVGDVSVAEPGAAQHLYRIAQEALSNAARHAHAGRIAVALLGGEDGLLLEVEDDGDGLPEEVTGAGMGLRTMASRAHLLQADLTVAPIPAGGTRVFCRVPRVGPGTPHEPATGATDARHGR